MAVFYVAHKFLQARDAAKEARKKGYPTRYPWRHKFVFHPKWVDQAFKIEGKKLILSMGDWNGKRQPKLTLTLPTTCYFGVRRSFFLPKGRS